MLRDMKSMSALAPNRSSRLRPRHGGLSRLLVGGLGWMACAAGWMSESLRLMWFAMNEIDALTWTLLSLPDSALKGPALDGAFALLRRNADRQRQWASDVGKVPLHAEYRQLQHVEPSGLDMLRAQLADPARARDLDWHFINPALTASGAIVSWALVFSGVNTLLVFASATKGGDAYHLGFYFGYYGLVGQLFLFGLALAEFAAAPLVARLVQRIHARWVRFMLAGEVSENLEERVRTLTVSRLTALDMQEAEIQRIERDLHDGAQARLVSIGMTVTQASRLMKHDPDATLALLDDVKNDSVIALQEIRTLVRGIRPPVLADRGLPDALRALAASNPIDTRVSSTLEGRLVGSVESALFFAASELMTNATKHSSASRITVELCEETGEVVLEIMDDGLGGAEGQDMPGGGIAGVRHRLSPFDGTLEIVSPVGGGTFATIRVPRPSEGPDPCRIVSQ